MPLISAILHPMLKEASVGEDNFNWVVETAAIYAIERALESKDGLDNLTWGEYIKRSTVAETIDGIAYLQ